MSEELKRGIPRGKFGGYVEVSAEERERIERDCEAILRGLGALKVGQSINNTGIKRI